MLEDEFNRIWDAQSNIIPSAADQNKAQTYFHHIIFHQRPLKAPEPGFCSYILREDIPKKDRYRIPRAMPTFQRYRILQEINNLCWNTDEGMRRIIDYPDARDAVIKTMEAPTKKQKEVSFKQIRNILKNHGIMDSDHPFNIESDRRPKLDANKTSTLMSVPERIGKKEWSNWSLDKQDEFISIILDHRLSDEDVEKKLQADYGLNAGQAQACAHAPLPDGHAHLCHKAAKILIEYMKDRFLIQADAVEKAAENVDAFENPGRRRREGEILDRLPYYGDAIQGHIIPGTGDPNDPIEKQFGAVTNVTVHIALNQIRKVINELISMYGSPYSIAVELSRDLPMGEEARSKLKKEYKENQETNDRLTKKIKEIRKSNAKVTADSKLRMRLWEDLGESCTDRRCPFSGEMISLSQVLNGETEIDHLIPYSISLDDSRANKVLCSRKANRDKGNRTPYEAFGHNPEGYNWFEILKRSELFPKRCHKKLWRFQEDAKELWQGKHSDFLARHLNDTRYIGRLTKEYLENICPYNKIDVLTGRHTALLRRHWGLQNIFSEGQQEKKKSRDDHRHHAIDAITAGMTTLSVLQGISTRAQRWGDDHLGNQERELDLGELAQEPWEGFRADVREKVVQIRVSHRAHHAKQGQLHNETAYGIPALRTEKELDFKKKLDVVTRKPIETFTTNKHLEKIRGTELRNLLIDIYSEEGIDGVQQFAARKGIRSLRIVEKLSVIPIRSQEGRIYKAYKGDSNWAMEIYKDIQSEKWAGVIVTRFEANQKANKKTNQKKFQPGVTKRPHPTSPLVMRLQRNDCLEIVQDDGQALICRVVKLGTSGQIMLCPLHEANVDARNRDKNTEFKYISKTAGTLQKSNARKVHISPAGRLSYGK
ncbi:MAG: type II CRISPR RNA-guided endonuclease Cas9 [Candidatus Eutrophobiaceae bacterium]